MVYVENNFMTRQSDYPVNRSFTDHTEEGDNGRRGVQLVCVTPGLHGTLHTRFPPKIPKRKGGVITKSSTQCDCFLGRTN